MKKAPLYSNASRARARRGTPVVEEPPKELFRKRVLRVSKKIYSKHEGPVLLVLGILLIVSGLGVYVFLSPVPQHLTQRDINNAVTYTLSRQPRKPSDASIAYDVVRPSVVRVNGYGVEESDEDKKDGKDGK